MKERREFYDARAAVQARENQRGYAEFVRRAFQSLVPPGLRVVEVGCGLGDLLAAVQPSRGVGIDFSAAMIDQARSRHPKLEFQLAEARKLPPSGPYDYILLSDLVNDLPDVQEVFEQLLAMARPRTRLIVQWQNRGWRPVLAADRFLRGQPRGLPQNWLSRRSLVRLLELAGWEVVKEQTRVLWPYRTPGLAAVLNRGCAPFLPAGCLARFVVARPRPRVPPYVQYRCSIVLPARNQAAWIADVARRIPELGSGSELIFVEDHSTDRTWEEIQRVKSQTHKRVIQAIRQQSQGKPDALREALATASGDLFFILDPDLRVPPEVLTRFYEAARSGEAEFVNGVRFLYPAGPSSGGWLTRAANRGFAFAAGWTVGQPIADALCTAKALFRADLQTIVQDSGAFGAQDPFGDLDLLFGAAKLNLAIMDVPIPGYSPTAEAPPPHRWKQGGRALRAVLAASRRLRFSA